MAKQPYFNEAECQEHYRRYVERGDKAALDALIAQSISICQYNAVKIAPGQQERIDDLTQVGLERILDICYKRKYTPDRGKLFPFLTASTFNKMIDYSKMQQRGHVRWCSEAENVATEMEIPPDPAIMDELRQRTRLYIVRRFPSLRPEIAIEATEYLCDCLGDGRCIDTTHGAAQRVKQTLAECWNIHKWHFALACRAYLGLIVSGEPCHEDAAIQMIMAHPKLEWSNAPEALLIMGPEMYQLMVKCLGSTSMRLTPLNGHKNWGNGK